MSLESDLTGRSGGVCELCGMENARTACDVPPEADGSAEMAVLLCRTCLKGVTGDIKDAPHWRCLSEAVWSTYAPVQVTAYRLLQRLSEQHWARDVLESSILSRLCWHGLKKAHQQMCLKLSTAIQMAYYWQLVIQ